MQRVTCLLALCVCAVLPLSAQALFQDKTDETLARQPGGANAYLELDQILRTVEVAFNETSKKAAFLRDETATALPQWQAKLNAQWETNKAAHWPKLQQKWRHAMASLQQSTRSKWRSARKAHLTTTAYDAMTGFLLQVAIGLQKTGHQIGQKLTTGGHDTEDLSKAQKETARQMAKDLVDYYDGASEESKALMDKGAAEIDQLIEARPKRNAALYEKGTVCADIGDLIREKFDGAVQKGEHDVAERYLAVLGLCMIRPDMVENLKQTLNVTMPDRGQHDSARLQKRDYQKTVAEVAESEHVKAINAKVKETAHQLDRYVRTHSKQTLLFGALLAGSAVVMPKAVMLFLAAYLTLAAFGLTISALETPKVDGPPGKNATLLGTEAADAKPSLAPIWKKLDVRP